MAKSRSPNRDKAFEIFRDNKGKITNRAIAEQLGISEKTVGGWKAKDKWLDQLNGVLQINERSTPKKRGAPLNNTNAAGNKGGSAPKGNKNAVTHGLFANWLPEESLQIIQELSQRSPADMIWDNIMIQYTAIIRAQRIMYVADPQDMTKELSKVMDTESGGMNEWEIQFAWDKQAQFMNAQSRAITTLASLIKQFVSLADEEDVRRLKLQTMQLQVDRANLEVTALRAELEGDDGANNDDGFLTAIDKSMDNVWGDYDGEG